MSVVEESCEIECGGRMPASVELCRWRLGLTRRVGNILLETAAVRCMGEAASNRNGPTDATSTEASANPFSKPSIKLAQAATNHGPAAMGGSKLTTTLEFRLQRIVPLELQINDQVGLRNAVHACFRGGRHACCRRLLKMAIVNSTLVFNSKPR